jgi:hypothetical protein
MTAAPKPSEDTALIERLNALSESPINGRCLVFPSTLTKAATALAQKDAEIARLTIAVTNAHVIRDAANKRAMRCCKMAEDAEARCAELERENEALRGDAARLQRVARAARVWLDAKPNTLESCGTAGELRTACDALAAKERP